MSMAESKPQKGVVAGSFAAIHLGYVRLFIEAEENCQDLYILLHGDPTIERPHKNKPVHSASERREILQKLCPNAIILVYNTEDQLHFLLQAIDPDVRFLGDDYVDADYTGKDLDIPVHWIDRSHGWSTTLFTEMVAKGVKEKPDVPVDE